MKRFLAIEIGGTKLQLAAGNARGDILQRWRFDVDPARRDVGIRGQIESVLPEILRAHEIAAIGVGFGGPVDSRTGQICCSHQIEGWSEFQLGDWLRERTRRSAAIENDANVGALGEALRGAGQGRDPVFYVTLGSGVGGGLVEGGNIYHGAKPGEAEIGHVRLERSGVTVEDRCSGWAVDAKILAAAGRNPTSVLARLISGMVRGQARELARALGESCPIARSILSEVAEDLAFGLSHVTHLLHPEVIVLGGGLSLIGEPLRAAVATALRRFVMEAFAPGPQVALAALQEDAVPVGALLLAASQFSDASGAKL